MTINETPYSLLYLWRLRTLYMGEMFELATQTPAASALLLALEKPFRIRDSRTAEFVQTRSALVPAGVSICVETPTQIMACCYLDPLGRDKAAFEPGMRRQHGLIRVDSENEQQQLQVCADLYQARAPAAEAYRVLMQNIFPQHLPTAPITVDARIAEVVELIRRDPVSNLSNQLLAQQVGLSEVQLQRLFKQVTGIPVRRYRLWHRLFVTASLMMLGRTLTDAAIEAGFSDSSHFNHAFRSILGMKPSSIFLRRQNIIIQTGGDELDPATAVTAEGSAKEGSAKTMQQK
jgi:AraC-like DNA-binding protein